MLPIVIGVSGIVLSTLVLVESANLVYENVKNKDKQKEEKKDILRIYICAYQSFHTSLCLEYNGTVIEYEWNTFKNEDSKTTLGLLKNVYKTGPKINWEEKEIAICNCNLENFIMLINHIDSKLVKTTVKDYDLFGNNCRTFVDMVIQIIETYLSKYIKEEITLKKCKDFNYLFGSGFEINEIKIGKSYEKFVSLLTKLVTNAQDERKKDYLLKAYCLVIFNNMKFKR